MRTIKSETARLLTGLRKEAGTLTARFIFPPEFIGFQGHFPTKKILPGVCQIQCALSTLEKGNGRAVLLKEVVLAKYFSPVFPDEEMTCVVTDNSDGRDDFIIKAAITKGAVKVAELKLRVSYANEGGGATA